MKFSIALFFSLLLLKYSNLNAASIVLHTKNATVWLPQQIITGEIKDFNVKSILLYVNDFPYVTEVKNFKFSVSVLLKEVNNKIWAEGKDSQQTFVSDTIIYKLGYKPLPLVKPVATKKGELIKLSAEVIQNPYKEHLIFFWKGDDRNPGKVLITNDDNGFAKVSLPSKKGTYFFNLIVTAGKSSTQFQTYVTRDDSIHCFSLENDHAAWIDSAVLYEIAPNVFIKNGQYSDITRKLPELKQLGVNAIWLQPVFKTHDGGQGYDITDYFSLRNDLGVERELKQLITTAKALDMRVLFDFVPNHTSIFHPYVTDCLLNGKNSHYYNFYQREDDGAMYSSLYSKDTFGFYHYFWNKLVNLNYKNYEVQQWVVEACKYWVKNYDIDGYRFDAVWGINARAPEFGKLLQLELKSIKPDILMLAEDKGAKSNVYEMGFDAAYDWTEDTVWISHWPWQYQYDPKRSFTIFNFPDENRRGDMLCKALFDNADSQYLRLRFIENNDLPRFIVDHDLSQTKMAAALVFSLPGIPLIYNGQEIGSDNHPYSSHPVFLSPQTIKSQDKESLFEYYQQLIAIRKEYKSLRSNIISELPVTPAEAIVVFNRHGNKEDFIVLINLSTSAYKTVINVDSIVKHEQQKNFFLIDVMTGEKFRISKNKAEIKINGYTTRLMLLKKL